MYTCVHIEKEKNVAEELEESGWKVTCPECEKDIPLEEFQYGHDCE